MSTCAMEAPADALSRARRGDEAAFEELMRMHERQVLRTALRLLGRLEDAEDAAQEAFLRLYRNLRGFHELAEIRPWLYRVTVNVCYAWGGSGGDLWPNCRKSSRWRIPRRATSAWRSGASC